MNLVNDNYFSTEASMAYFGSSQFKSFMDCEARTMAEIKGEYKKEPSVSMLVGSYVDAYFSNEMPEFLTAHPEIFNKRTDKLKSQFVQADKIIDRIERDPLMMEYLDGEKQQIMTGKIFGFPFKIKIDAFHKDKIVDLKIMRDMNLVYKKGEWKTFIDAWGYDIQGFIYQSVVEYQTGKKLPFYLAVATKEEEPDIAVIEIPQWRLDSMGEIVKYFLPHFARLKAGEEEPKRCEKCAYCKSTKVLTSVTKYEDLFD